MLACSSDQEPEAADVADAQAQTTVSSASVPPGLRPGLVIPNQAMERPNLLLISVDTLRADFLGCYGQPKNTSPSMDELAASGTRFDHAVAASPWTLPSHATMLSGLYPSHHGVVDHNFELTAPTLATRLQAAGYHTMAIVNSKNIGDKRFGMMRGYDRAYYELEVDVIKEDDGTQSFGVMIHNHGRDIIDRASYWLAERDTNQPFFLFLHFYDVHTDFTPDEKWKEKFVGPYNGELNGRTRQLVKLRHDDEGIKKRDAKFLKEMYAAEIRTFDNILTKFLRRMRENGLMENTVIALTSDHGEEFGEHGSVLHGRTYYEEQTRIPLILHGPGIPAGFQMKRPVHLIDVAPTLLSLAGLPLDGMDGIDLTRSWFAGEGPSEDRVLFAEADHNILVAGIDSSNVFRMLRKNEFKLIFNTLTGERKLFNLLEDPSESKDIAHEQPDLAQALLDELKLFSSTGIGGSDIGPLPTKDVELMGTLGYISVPDDEEDD